MARSLPDDVDLEAALAAERERAYRAGWVRGSWESYASGAITATVLYLLVFAGFYLLAR